MRSMKLLLLAFLGKDYPISREYIAVKIILTIYILIYIAAKGNFKLSPTLCLLGIQSTMFSHLSS